MINIFNSNMLNKSSRNMYNNKNQGTHNPFKNKPGTMQFDATVT